MSAPIWPWRGVLTTFAGNWYHVGFKRALQTLVFTSSHMAPRRWLYWNAPPPIKRIYRRWRRSP